MSVETRKTYSINGEDFEYDNMDDAVDHAWLNNGENNEVVVYEAAIRKITVNYTGPKVGDYEIIPNKPPLASEEQNENER